MASCRFYANLSPGRGDIVMVRGQRKSNEAGGIYVELLEYDGLEGFVPIREYRCRTWEGRAEAYGSALLGRVLCAEVTDVNESDIIGLSLKSVTKDDEKMCRNRYLKTKCVQSICKRVANRLNLKTKLEFQKLIENCVWKLMPKSGPSCQAYDIFKKAVLGNVEVLDNIDEDVKQVLIEEAQKRLSKKPVEISSTFDVTCYRREGIDAIQRALFTGLACSRDDVQLKINLVRCPTFIIKTCTLDEDLAVEIIGKALASVEESILKSGGDFNVLSRPTVVQSATVEEDSDEEFVEDSGIVEDFENLTCSTSEP